jgi:hypothetical protein
VASLTLQLQSGDCSAAMLATIGSFLAKSGVKATDDSPNIQRLTRAYDSLPFTTESEQTTKGPSPQTKGPSAQTNEKEIH